MQLTDVIAKANILMEALPYIQEFRGITVVIKYGGAALVDENIKSSIIQDIALMKYVGFKPVVVHGGGPEINRMLGRLGLKSRFVNGLRFTDGETMEVVEMVLAGKVNKRIVSEIAAHGTKAVGLSGKDGGLLTVQPAAEGELGFVGEVTEVDVSVIKALVENDFIPVIAPIGADGEGQTYNINADYAAVAVAGALRADKLVFLTDVPGVLRDASDPSTVISSITLEEVHRLKYNGTISGGMIPKVDCAVSGVAAGVGHVHILDGRVQHALILEIFTQEGIGTLIKA
ncbi:MAG: acetylglutamate kinase [Clostridiales bacterium]|jgi:acetylglutamate kinase|nr:acetylglutamate kinase [Clostridiales bacterium]